jgi:hypothetical protein
VEVKEEQTLCVCLEGLRRRSEVATTRIQPETIQYAARASRMRHSFSGNLIQHEAEHYHFKHDDCFGREDGFYEEAFHSRQHEDHLKSLLSSHLYRRIPIA